MRILSAVATLFVSVLLAAPAFGQDVVPDRNVNMVAGTSWPGGDPYLQRQNEPSIAVSTRNPLHILAGANDYRTVDVPGLDGIKVIGDAWNGVFRSYDGGNTWTSTLLPGYPQDGSVAGLASPLKGYAAGADAVVRAGANGLFYYAGIVLNREENPLGAVFVARYLDSNNKESSSLVREQAHSIRYVDTSVLQRGTSGQFNDKPWLAVDIPRPGSLPCTVSGQRLEGGNAYLVWTILVGGDSNVRSQMMIARTTDCGATWEAPTKLNESHAINQGAAVAIDPATGSVYVAWRRISNEQEPNALLFSKSVDFGRTFTKAQEIRTITPFEQGTTALSFRTTAFPTMAVDGSGRIYIAWSERGSNGDGRIAMISSGNASDWSAPGYVVNYPDRGHQFMPALNFSNGKLTLGWYDQREDHTTGIYLPVTANGKLTGQYSEQRRKEGHLQSGLIDYVFNAYIQELAAPSVSLLRRHTLDVFVAQADPGVFPNFQSTRASQYAFGSRRVAGNTLIEQMQFSAPNLPLFRLGTRPFIGDYLDVTSSDVMTKGASGWKFSTEAAKSPVRHIVWTDNRDVRPPLDGNWQNYTPVGSTGASNSVFDSTVKSPKCAPGQTGMRNQNIYTTRITNGLFAGSPGNTKPFLSGTGEPLQRAFVVFVQNTLKVQKTYRLTILNQPAGGKASFLQRPEPGFADPLTILDVTVGPRSSIARSVFATSSSKYHQIDVRVQEITAPQGSVVASGLESVVVLNPDIANPDIANPDIANPDIANPDIANAEVYNPDIANPDIANPDIANPDIANPDIANPDIANPDIANPDIANPDIANPDIANPDIANPDIANPDIANGSVTDTTWAMTNQGNTAATYSVNLLLNGQAPDAFKLQLILYRLYTTPIARDCTLELERHTVLAANINNPVFTAPGDLAASDITDSSEKNATFWLLPGETMLVTLRVVDPNRFDNVVFNAAEQVSPVSVAHAINTTELALPNPQRAVSLTIVTTRLPDAITGIGYPGTTTLQAVGGNGSRNWTAVTPLPQGLSLSGTGVVSGVATLAGTSSFTVAVQDTFSPLPHSDQEQIRIRVVDLLTIPAQALAPASTGDPYTATLAGSGGVPPFAWSVASGALPAGLTLSSAGVISGTTAETGTFSFTVQLVDGTYPAPQSVARQFSLTAQRRPDLVVASLTHSPADPTTSTLITFAAIVKNVGGSVAGPSHVRIKVGSELLPPEFAVPALQVEESFTVTRQLTLPVAQNYVSTATADVHSTVTESNETNNVATDVYTVVASVPDLIIESLTHTPANPAVSTSITFTAVVKNAGNGAAGPSQVRFQVGSETSPPEFEVPALAVNQSFTVTRQLVLSVAQNYVNTATADIRNLVAESNETNNVRTDSYSVVTGYTVIGTLTYAGVPITPGAAPQFVLRNGSTGQVLSNPISYAGGRFTITGLPPGTYSIEVSSDENPANSPFGPGDYHSLTTFDAATASLNGLTVSLTRAIRMTSPHDNAAPFDVTVRACPRPLFAVAPTINIAWDSVPLAASYSWAIQRVVCPFINPVLVASGSTAGTSVVVTLTPAAADQYYLLTIDAYTSAQIPVGRLMTKDRNSHAFDHRFTVTSK